MGPEAKSTSQKKSGPGKGGRDLSCRGEQNERKRQKQHKKNEAIVYDCYARLLKSKVSPQEAKTKQSRLRGPSGLLQGGGSVGAHHFTGPARHKVLRLWGMLPQGKRLEAGRRWCS